jgi:DNA replication and repair protein RecF
LKLKTVELREFRNIKHGLVELGSGINTFIGKNGQGKTSFLESIHLLGNLRSFRESDLSVLIRQGAEGAMVHGVFNTDGLRSDLRVELGKPRGRLEKRASVNGKLARSAADYFSQKLAHPAIQFHTVALNPSSTELIHGEPSLRRRMLNHVLSGFDPQALSLLTQTQRVTDHKSALLKEPQIDEELLATLNQQLVQLGAQVRQKRLILLMKIEPIFREFLGTIAPTQRVPKLGLKTPYLIQMTGHFAPPSVQDLEDQLHVQLAEKSGLERIRQTTLVGPHRDDLVFSVDGPRDLSLAEVGSQGEIRSALLALKLAEVELFKKETQIRPVFLIDDFSSELDEERRTTLLNYLNQSDLQVFVSSTEDFPFAARRFRVVEGEIV